MSDEARREVPLYKRMLWAGLVAALFGVITAAIGDGGFSVVLWVVAAVLIVVGMIGAVVRH